MSGASFTHVLFTILCDTRPMLVDTYNGRIDQLHGRIVSRRQAIHDPIPDASPSPAAEAIVASRRRSIALRQIAPRRAQSEDWVAINRMNGGDYMI
jgi:hypothetical protein